jgi:hypothetical protein
MDRPPARRRARDGRAEAARGLERVRELQGGRRADGSDAAREDDGFVDAHASADYPAFRAWCENVDRALGQRVVFSK